MILTMILPFVLVLGLVLVGGADVLLLCQKELPTWWKFWRGKKFKYRDKNNCKPGVLDRYLQQAKQVIQSISETSNYETRKFIPSRRGQRNRREWDLLRFTAMAIATTRCAGQVPSTYEDLIWGSQLDEPWAQQNPERDKVKLWSADEVRITQGVASHDPPWSPVGSSSGIGARFTSTECDLANFCFGGKLDIYVEFVLRNTGYSFRPHAQCPQCTELGLRVMDTS